MKKKSKIYLEGAPEGYMNLSNYDQFKKNDTKDIFKKENIKLDDARIFEFDADNVVYVINNIRIDAYSNGKDTYFDPIQLYKLYVGYEGKSKQRLRQEYKNNIPNKFLVDLLVSNKDNIRKTTLVTEEGLYFMILNCNNPKVEQLQEKMLTSIHEQRIGNNILLEKFLKVRSIEELVDPNTSSQIIDNSLLDKNSKNVLNKMCNKGEIILNYIYHFPTLDGIKITNENMVYYISNLERVKLSHVINIRIRLDRVVCGIANAFDTDEETIRDIIRDNDFDIYTVEENLYVSMESIDNLLRRYKKPKEKMRKFLYQVTHDDKISKIILETLYSYNTVINNYPINIYFEYQGYIELDIMSKEEVKAKILEKYKNEITF